MLENLMIFVRKVVLDAQVSQNLRSEGLDLLINANRQIVDGSKPVCIFLSDGCRFFIPSHKHREIQDQVKAGQKIPAIKLLRAIYTETFGASLGLKKAKDAVESSRNFQQLGA